MTGQELPHPANDFAADIYNDRPDHHSVSPFGETVRPLVSQSADEQCKIMGDKSPKFNQEKSKKQSTANRADQKKTPAVDADAAVAKQKSLSANGGSPQGQNQK